MDVSIGIPAYNEEKNIVLLLSSLLKQKTKVVKIKEIIIVSSGSTDNTDKIVKSIVKKNKKIKLLVQKKRVGKASAINLFLQHAKSSVVVLESADTIPKDDSIEKLCLPLKNPKVGIVASRPTPKNSKKNYLGYVIKLQWLLHHKISLKKPKFGELIAFRKLFSKIENTAADEEYIAMRIKNNGFAGVYVPGAIVYNKGPETVSDFIKQRRRIYCGHLELKNRKNYKASTVNNLQIFKFSFEGVGIMDIPKIIFAILLESFGRLLGVYDYYSGKDHSIWEVSKTTK